jgi:hypothetical protein
VNDVAIAVVGQGNPRASVSVNDEQRLVLNTSTNVREISCNLEFDIEDESHTSS